MARVAPAPHENRRVPLTPSTLTRLDPSRPLLWRDDTTLQLGDDGTLRLSAEQPWVEPLLSRLRHGFRRSAYDVIAHAAGAPWDEARRLLALIAPALHDDPSPARAAWTSSLGLTDTRTEGRLREALADEGVVIAPPEDPEAVAVVLVPGAAAAVQFARQLRDDRAHLPVAFEPGRVTVGPLVVPGDTPCLSCRDLEDTERDPAWPLVHSQLIGRDPGRIPASRVGEAARLAAVLLASNEAGRLARVSADGRCAWRSVSFREECLCREPSSPSRPGTATVRAPLALPTATRRSPAFARPA